MAVISGEQSAARGDPLRESVVPRCHWVTAPYAGCNFGASHHNLELTEKTVEVKWNLKMLVLLKLVFLNPEERFSFLRLKVELVVTMVTIYCNISLHQ